MLEGAGPQVGAVQLTFTSHTLTYTLATYIKLMFMQ